MKVHRFMPSIAVLLLICASPTQPAFAKKIPRYGPNPELCMLLPIPDLEALYQGKAGTPCGFDESSGSICDVSIAGRDAKLDLAPLADPRAPHYIQEGVALVSEMSSDHGGNVTFENQGLRLESDSVIAMLNLRR